MNLKQFLQYDSFHVHGDPRIPEGLYTRMNRTCKPGTESSFFSEQSLDQSSDRAWLRGDVEGDFLFSPLAEIFDDAPTPQPDLKCEWGTPNADAGETNAENSASQSMNVDSSAPAAGDAPPNDYYEFGQGAARPFESMQQEHEMHRLQEEAERLERRSSEQRRERHVLEQRESQKRRPREKHLERGFSSVLRVRWKSQS